MKLFVIPIAIALMSSGIASAKSRPIKDPSTPEARNTLTEATSCIVSTSPDESSSLLRMDFRTPAYKGKMQRLFDNNRNCFKDGWLRAHGLLVAGGLAEQLLAKSPQKTNVRLAMLAPNSTQKPRTPTDAVAMCTARSDPDGVARLFASKAASAEETSAAQAMALAMSRCNPTNIKISVSPAGLRAMLATATYRLLEGQED